MQANGNDASLAGFTDGTFSVNGTSVSVASTDTIDSFLKKVNDVSSQTGVSVLVHLQTV
ncbi:hypothetical protein OVA29_04405 [Exiguobacterium sp. SL14]|nr:flagellin hook IN motif-containing protein [Exiguobacterium sp. SL14]MCY1690147.1 hypothetical protein [Exiguobacterium sp. SL14]